MKYIKPHLSPELRAQITPHRRRDIKLTTAGMLFSVLSLLLVINLWPKNSDSPLPNNNPSRAFIQSDSTANAQEKQVLGEATVAEETAAEQFTQYTVQNGDTLFNISQEYNIRWDLIAEINSLAEPYLLHAGMILKIPQTTTSSVPNKIYTIESGDTLITISQAFNITVNDIIAVNPNLQQSDLITVGQVIKLP